MILANDDQVDAIMDAIIESARTGQIGDGKIFVSPVEDVIRIRTFERGVSAL
jgi:nitrogen regulatory protein PII